VTISALQIKRLQNGVRGEGKEIDAKNKMQRVFPKRYSLIITMSPNTVYLKQSPDDRITKITEDNKSKDEVGNKTEIVTQKEVQKIKIKVIIILSDHSNHAYL